MNCLPRRLAAVALASTLLVGLAACGSSDASDGADKATTTAAAADGGTAKTTAASGATDTTAKAAGGACVTDSNELSGSSTVVWKDGTPVADKTLTFTDDGTLDPSTLEVGVGEQFFVASPAGSDIRSVKIGCAGGQTVPAGITAGFVINAAGTYTITDEAADGYAGADVGTVTVK